MYTVALKYLQYVMHHFLIYLLTENGSLIIIKNNISSANNKIKKNSLHLF